MINDLIKLDIEKYNILYKHIESSTITLNDVLVFISTPYNSTMVSPIYLIH